MTPAPMTDEQILSVYSRTDDEDQLRLCRAIIAARDAQWAEMLKGQEPVAWGNVKIRREGERYYQTLEFHPTGKQSLQVDHTALLRQALEALEQWAGLINHQYTGTREGMTALQHCDDTGQLTITAIKKELGC